MARIIAGKVGYPTAPLDPFVNAGLVRLSRAQAAHVLAVAGTTSLAHGGRLPAKDSVDKAADALGDLASDAIFWSNGLWEPGSSFGWSPLSARTFDCGVIGFDVDNAFIFWAEEED